MNRQGWLSVIINMLTVLFRALVSPNDAANTLREMKEKEKK